MHKHVQRSTWRLQVLNAIANGNDVGSLTSAVCRAIIHGSAPAQCKRLAYDVVKAGGLADQDWDEVCEGLKSDIGSQINLEVGATAADWTLFAICLIMGGGISLDAVALGRCRPGVARKSGFFLECHESALMHLAALSL